MPCLLDMPEPTVLEYSRNSIVAEKLAAMIVLGDRKSRIKDFVDTQAPRRELQLRQGDADRGGPM